MYFELIYIFLTDPQDVPPAAFCPYCGSERYWPSLVCLRCEGSLL